MASPYYLFGYQRRYPYAWHGGAGGVPGGYRAAETRELGQFNLEESGLDPYSLNFPALAEGETDEPADVIAPGDWPALRPAGPEPLDPSYVATPMGFIGDLSDNEKRLLWVGAAALGAWFWWRRGKKGRGRRRRR